MCFFLTFKKKKLSQRLHIRHLLLLEFCCIIPKQYHFQFPQNCFIPSSCNETTPPPLWCCMNFAALAHFIVHHSLHALPARLLLSDSHWISAIIAATTSLPIFLRLQQSMQSIIKFCHALRHTDGLLDHKRSMQWRHSVNDCGTIAAAHCSLLLPSIRFNFIRHSLRHTKLTRRWKVKM